MLPELLQSPQLDGPPHGVLYDWTRTAITQWIGPCYGWVPHSINLTSRVDCFVSSRIGRHPHRRPLWFQMLRSVMNLASRQNDPLLICEGTAASPWVTHAAELFRCQGISLEVAPDGDRVNSWRERLAREPAGNQIMLSPVVDPSWTSLAPRRDVASIFLATHVFVPLIHSGGNIHQLLNGRLESDLFQLGSTWVSVPDNSPRVVQPLIDRGAVGWYTEQPGGNQSDGAKASVPSEQTKSSTAPAPIVKLSQLTGDWAQTGDYLVHCTRERSGPWPNQSMRSYRDELVLGFGADQTMAGPLASLSRILAQSRIEGSSTLIGGSTQVVSFSGCPIVQLLSRRTFRSHLSRWDYEPYGIAIGRPALESLGARPVIYGESRDSDALNEPDRPFFQSSGARSQWVEENEWRTVGPVLLDKIATDEAFLFVPSEPEAQRLAPTSRWPIALVDV